MLSELEGLNLIMDIIEGKIEETKVDEILKEAKESRKAQKVEKEETKVEKETIYEHGCCLSIDGQKQQTGYIKNQRKNTSPKDEERKSLFDLAEVILNRNFEKVGKNKNEGIVIRMEDADYTVKITAHVKPEFTDIDSNFKPEINFTTRGKAINHSPLIAKALISEIEKEYIILAASSSVVRFKKKDQKEYSFKITKKRSRVVLD